MGVISRLPVRAFNCFADQSLESQRAAPKDQVINQQHNDGANDGHDNAVKVQSGDIALPEKSCSQKAANDGSNNSENNIQDEAFAGFIYYFAGDKARDEAKDKPRYNRH